MFTQIGQGRRRQDEGPCGVLQIVDQFPPGLHSREGQAGQQAVGPSNQRRHGRSAKLCQAPGAPGRSFEYCRPGQRRHRIRPARTPRFRGGREGHKARRRHSETLLAAAENKGRNQDILAYLDMNEMLRRISADTALLVSIFNDACLQALLDSFSALTRIIEAFSNHYYR